MFYLTAPFFQEWNTIAAQALRTKFILEKYKKYFIQIEYLLSLN